MTDFLLFINKLAHNFPLHIEIYYSKIMDWCIKVYKCGCAEDYSNSPSSNGDAVLCDIQESDMELAFAKAHVEVKEWMLENKNGY